MKKRVNKFIYWTPRILSIILIIFLSLFSLDVFEEGSNLFETILALFIHNLPSLILLLVLIISWRYEIVGGIAFILAGLAYIAFVLSSAFKTGFEWYHLAWTAQISGVAFLIGILFFINWRKKQTI